MPKRNPTLLDQQIAARSFDDYRHGRELDDTLTPSQQLKAQKRVTYAVDWTGLAPRCFQCPREAYALTELDGEEVPCCDWCDTRIQLPGWQQSFMDAPLWISPDVELLYQRSLEQ